MEDDPVRYLTLQFLDWVGDTPRPYGEVIDAWRTSCPRLPVWEDAMSAGLVMRIPGATLRDGKIVVTEKGKQAMKMAHLPPTIAPHRVSKRR